MRNWDLTGGAAKLELALKTLRQTATEIEESWDDQNYRRFVETYVIPVEPRLRTMLEAIRRLAEVLDTAERQCRDERQ